MAKVKTFRIHPAHGVPDKDIQAYISMCEKEGIVSVSVTYIPPDGTIDGRLTVIVTKLDSDYETPALKASA